MNRFFYRIMKQPFTLPLNVLLRSGLLAVVWLLLPIVASAAAPTTSGIPDIKKLRNAVTETINLNTHFSNATSYSASSDDTTVVSV